MDDCYIKIKEMQEEISWSIQYIYEKAKENTEIKNEKILNMDDRFELIDFSNIFRLNKKENKHGDLSGVIKIPNTSINVNFYDSKDILKISKKVKDFDFIVVFPKRDDIIIPENILRKEFINGEEMKKQSEYLSIDRSSNEIGLFIVFDNNKKEITVEKIKKD